MFSQTHLIVGICSPQLVNILSQQTLALMLSNQFDLLHGVSKNFYHTFKFFQFLLSEVGDIFLANAVEYFEVSLNA